LYLVTKLLLIVYLILPPINKCEMKNENEIDFTLLVMIWPEWF